MKRFHSKKSLLKGDCMKLSILSNTVQPLRVRSQFLLFLLFHSHSPLLHVPINLLACVSIAKNITLHGVV